MTVQELIDELEQVKNKNLDVFVYHDGELLSIGFIDEVKFYMNDLDGKDYFVHAYAQDPEESDEYTIEISEVLEDKDEEVCVLYVDSSGNMTDEISDEPYVTKALDVLFIDLAHGIIRGF